MRSAPRRRPFRPWFVAALLAGFCALVLHTRVYTSFERLRLVVTRTAQAAEGGVVAVSLPDLSLLAGQPVAVVLRLSSDGATGRVARVAIGNALRADVPLAPGRQVRVDLGLADGAALAVGDVVTVTADGDGWSLTYLELANVHGFSRGLFEFMVVPASARAPHRVGALLSVALFVLMLRFPGFPAGAVRNRIVRVAYGVVAALVGLFLAAILVAALVSDYGILLAWHTFLVLLAVLYYPTLEGVFRRQLPVLRAAGVYLRQALRRTGTAIRSRYVPFLYTASIVLFVVGVARFYDPETGFTIFIHFGSQFEERMIPALRDLPVHVEPNSFGYDGQFYAQLAVDPLLLDPATSEALDLPSYRARRMLISWTAFLLGLGQPLPIVHAYAIQNALFWVMLALLLMRWFPARDFRSFCLWFGCLFSQGAIVSVVRALPDGPSLLLLALAVFAVERGRNGRAAVLAGLAGLAKDSNLTWSTVLLDPAVVRGRGRRWREVCAEVWRWGLLVMAPLALWVLYLWIVDYSANMGGFRNFAAPLTAYVTTWSLTLSALREGVSPYYWLKLFALISLAVQALVLIVVRAPDNPWWRAGIASCMLMVFLGPAVWDGYPSAAGRVLLPMTVAFNAVLPCNRWFWPLFVLGNLTVLNGLEALNILNWIDMLNGLEALRATVWSSMGGAGGA